MYYGFFLIFYLKRKIKALEHLTKFILIIFTTKKTAGVITSTPADSLKIKKMILIYIAIIPTQAPAQKSDAYCYGVVMNLNLPQ